MEHLINLHGRRFGNWEVTGYYHRKLGKTMWDCTCDCGTKRAVNGAELRNSKSTNCGCIRRKKVAARNYKHGMGHTRLHGRWLGMIARCEDPGNKGYDRYGGRGIQVCKRWRESFVAFLADMGHPPTEKYKIERRDNNGNYEPSNCCWATNKENCRNTRKNRIIEHQGVRLTLAEWEERLGINRATLTYRIDRSGWSIDKAFSTPVMSRSEAAKLSARQYSKDQ